MEWEISEFKEEDRAELGKLYIDVRRETFGWLGAENRIKDTFDIDTKGEDLIVAKVEDRIVGFVSVWLPDNFVHHLYIKRAYQGKGLGRDLINTVKSRIKGTLALKCMEGNLSAVKFYQKTGWKMKSKGISEHGVYILFELD